MENRRRGGNKRNSGIFEPPVHPLQRRTSKKTSSTDRHGQVYPDSFGDTSIRAVTPDPPNGPNFNGVPADLPYPPSSYAASPPSSVAGDARGQSREHLSSENAGGSEYSGRSGADSVTRPRTRTLEERIRDRSPTSLFSKTRTRLGSLQSSVPLLPESDDPSASIGFPSVQPIPPNTHQGPTSRQRLVKAPPRPLSPVRNMSIISRTTPQPSPTMDTSKILQLMKTTCGRMHGILSFRMTRSGAWQSGYCAINVATGSLIYQPKGAVTHAKTLIPDLRGCRVRTQEDAASRATFLAVCTHNSGLGIHLRPHVVETFDSWLAALLCWQPIRPKGSQNKMTKPQAPNVSERRFGDRRRNSAINLTKDAAIIKVGKMLFWDHEARIDTQTENRRWSTYKQQRQAAGTSWRKVSCTLQENGHIKLFLESDTMLIAIVPLSQLSRCAIQRLDPSVVDDEFCLAIYPQYTTANTTPGHLRPIYLSMESRVLLEVWFVLFRAFTVPELYGPEQPSLHAEGGSTSQVTEVQSSAISSMFRVEKVLSMRIIEAKLHAPKEVGNPLLQDLPRAGSSHGQDWVAGDYHAEVLLDGEIRARTVVKSDTHNPFWREDYEFTDLPAVLSCTSIVVKSRHLGQKDWTLISHYPEGAENGDTVNLGGGGDIEISPLDTMYGIVDLRLDDLERGKDTERWWPIHNDHDETVGELLMKVRTEEIVVLMSKDYQPLSELLHTFSNGLTHQIITRIPIENRRLPETLLNIFQVSGSASAWIMSLVEDEIDGIHKESSMSKFRYSRRIASNDSYDSGVEREMLLRDLGKSATVEANLLFRGNSLLTKALDLHMRRLGKEYLDDTLSERMRDIDESDPECEVDPNRVRNPEDLQRNWRNLTALTETVWRAIAASAQKCPPELRLIFRHIRACAEDRYGDFLRTIAYSSVSGFLFLRFFCPAVLNPKLFGLLKEHPRPRAQRTLTLIAKSLQTLANLTTFGSKEPWMEPMNIFLTSHRQQFKDFVDAICAISSERATSAIPPSYATPNTILQRLPATSREGFPSLPYLIDQSREFAALVSIWVDGMGDRALDPEASDEVKRFNEYCKVLRQRTRDCLNQAEQAERPSGTLEVKWEELIEQMDRKARVTPSNSTYPPAPSATAKASLTSSPVSTTHQIRKSPGRRRLTESSGSTTSASVSTNNTPYHSKTASVSHTSLSRPAIRHTTNGRSAPPILASARSSSDTTTSSSLTPPGSSSGVWDPGTSSSKEGSPEDYNRGSARFPSHALHWNDNDGEEGEEGIESLGSASGSGSGRGSIRSLEVEVERGGESEGGRRREGWNGAGIAPRSPVSPGGSGSGGSMTGGSSRRLVDVWGFRKRGGGGGTPRPGGRSGR